MIYDKIFNPNSPNDYFVGYKDYLKNILDKTDWAAVSKVAHMIIDAHKQNKTVYIIGNGGSFSTAAHFVCDLSKGTKLAGKKAIKSQALDSTAIYTAYVNDVAFEDVYVEQLSNVEPGDMLICISCSGNSPNIVKALNVVNKKGVQTVAFSGFDGGAIATDAAVNITVPSVKGEYGPVEDVHTVFMHMITTYIKKVFESEA